MRIARATNGEKLAISRSFMWCAHNGHARGRGAAAQHEGRYCAQELDLRGSASGRPTQFEEVTQWRLQLISSPARLQPCPAIPPRRIPVQAYSRASWQRS